MKIRGTCGNCGKEFLVEQVVASHGHCPWCGKAFTRDYTANLARALAQADAAGDVLEDALEAIADIHPAMDLDEESVLEAIREPLRAQRRRRTPA
ncbi:MAG TPA: hypothetical protein VF097_07880 [Actinomycetota bacterium]